MDSVYPYALGAVRVFTTDLERSRRFYAEILGMKPTSPDLEASHAVFSLGQAYLILEAIDPADPEAGQLVGRFLGVSLVVQDIAALQGTLGKSGVRFSGPPRRQAWGGTTTHFHDPDDNVITLVQWG